jgi:hypothetical protein
VKDGMITIEVDGERRAVRKDRLSAIRKNYEELADLALRSGATQEEVDRWFRIKIVKE